MTNEEEMVKWLYDVGYPFDFRTDPPVPAFLWWPLVHYAAAQDHTDPSWFTSEALNEYYELMADEGGWGMENASVPRRVTGEQT